MILYGKKGSVLKTEHLSNLTCPNCKTTGTLHCAVAGTYAHVYWIPFFPLGKKLITQCVDCKQVLEENEMPYDLREACMHLKSETKPPFWYFSGLGIIGLIMVWGSFASRQKDKDRQAYLADPQAGDRYEVKTKDGDYTVLKLAGTSGDTVFFYLNQYSVNKSSGLYKIDKAENYMEETVGILQSKLKEMHAEGKIIDINR